MRLRRVLRRPAWLAGLVLACGALSAGASVIIVANTTDAVNGDVSSPGALQGNPGLDGISLREALLAANNAVGPHSIVFSPVLSGKTIVLTSSLSITRDQISITGLATAENRPDLILDASHVANIVVSLSASGFSLTLLRLTGIGAAGGGIGVRAGGNNPATIENLRIENNIFEGQATVPNPNALSLGTNPQSSRAVLRNVSIIRNTFRQFPGEGDAVHVPADGADGTIENLTVEGNTFSEVVYPVEIVPTGTNNRIVSARIRDNTFLDNSQAITLGTIGNPGRHATGNAIVDTVITGNVFTGNNLAVQILAGLGATASDNAVVGTIISNNDCSGGGSFVAIGGGASGATNNRVSDTVISGNSVRNSLVGILVAAGRQAGSDGNLVSETRIVGNTLSESASGLNAAAGAEGASGNRIQSTTFSGNVVRNCSGAAVSITGGSGASTTGNHFSDTTISDDLIVGTRQFAAIGILGGGSGNSVERVRVANCTIAKNAAIGAPALGGGPGGTGSSVSGVSVVNTIFWQNAGDVGLPGPDDVRFCITAQAGLAGANGNIASDPRFVDAEGGDFHLLPGSPAIDSGTSEEASSRDLDGRPRFDDPATPNAGGGSEAIDDIGAYEYASVAAYRLTVAMAGTGNGTVTAVPSGIDCGSDCSSLYYAGTIVTLTPTPFPGSAFAGWAGDRTCGRVTIAGDKTCTARFLPARHTTPLPPRR